MFSDASQPRIPIFLTGSEKFSCGVLRLIVSASFKFFLSSAAWGEPDPLFLPFRRCSPMASGYWIYFLPPKYFLSFSSSNVSCRVGARIQVPLLIPGMKPSRAPTRESSNRNGTCERRICFDCPRRLLSMRRWRNRRALAPIFFSHRKVYVRTCSVPLLIADSASCN